MFMLKLKTQSKILIEHGQLQHNMLTYQDIHTLTKLPNSLHYIEN